MKLKSLNGILNMGGELFTLRARDFHEVIVGEGEVQTSKIS